MTAYDRPIAASLHVHLENGESWEATPDDLAKFGLVRRLDAYMTFEQALCAALRAAGLIERDITACEINPFRHLVEVAINYPDLIDHTENEGWAQLAEIERRQRASSESSDG